MNDTQKTTYWQTLRAGIRTSLKGLSLSLRHLKAARQRHAPTNVQDAAYFGQDTGVVTLRYPTEVIPVPDHGRYRLHNEMDDCIVCDKCAKICPVDCIEIEPIKATGEVGKASDGSPIRLYAARFDIDMAKCCYCGLCTTVCPTECLTMTKSYDYSEFDIRDMIYHFTNLSPEQAEEKKRLYEQFVAEKEAAKGQRAEGRGGPTGRQGAEAADAPKPAARPVFRPGVTKPAEAEATPAGEEALATAPEPTASEEKSQPRPVFKPTMKKPEAASEPVAENRAAEAPAEAAPAPRPRPVFKPTMKKAEPAASPVEPPVSLPVEAEPAAEAPAPKPRPVFKPSGTPPAHKKPTPPENPAEP